jgi:hypothetical protein
MLTLAGSVRSGSFTVFRDVTFDRGVRALTSSFYVLPDAPRLSIDGDGGPAFRFWWYRQSLSAPADGAVAARAGGLLVVTIDLCPSDADRVQLKRDIAQQFNIDGGADAVALLPMPIVSGTVALAIAAESGGRGDFVNQVAGNGPAKLVGDEQAAFAIDLTKDGAAMLATAIQQKLAVVHVRYDLTFEYHLDGVQLHVWCDARRAQSTAAQQASSGAINSASLRTALVAAQAAGITITSDAPIPPDQETALQALGQQLLDAALAATVVGPDGKSARPYASSIDATLNHTVTTSFGADQRAVVEALLPLADNPARSSRLVVIDLASGPRSLDVTVLCPVDFTNGLIAAVHFSIVYDGTGPDGRPLHNAADVAFGAGNARFVFHTLASAEQRQYRWQADVLYRDGSRATMPEVSSGDTLLVLSVDGLGVLKVDVSLGDVPLDVVDHVVVDLDYPPRSLTHQLILDGVHAQDSWQVVIGDTPPDALRWRPTFLASDGRRVEGDWRTGGAARVIVDAPPNLASTTAVQLVSAGDFSGLAQIIVDVAGATAASDTAQFTFSQPGQSARWSPHVDPGAPLAYRARFTIIGTDGTSRVIAWSAQDSPLLVVSDPSTTFRVQVVPKLLDLGGAWSAAVLTVEHVDAAAAIDDRDTLVLRDRSVDATWSFRVSTPDEHAYRYQLTLVPNGGAERRALPWQDASDAVLVLRPPA